MICFHGLLNTQDYAYETDTINEDPDIVVNMEL